MNKLPSCPRCHRGRIVEIAETSVQYPVLEVIAGEPQTGEGETLPDGDFGGFKCLDCQYAAQRIESFT